MHQLPRLRAPDVHALVKAARGKIFAIRTEGHRVDGLRVLGECVYAAATFHIPQTHRGIEGGRGEYKIRIGIVGPRASGRPLYRVDLLGVGLQIVTATITLHAPDLKCHVIGAGRKQLTLWTPFDGIHLVGVTTERLNGLVHAQPTHMDTLICAARGKRCVRLPIHVQGGCTVEGELLSALSGGGIPNDGGLVHTGGQDVIATFVPLEGEDRTLVLAQSGGQSTIGLPDACIAIITASGQQRTVAL